jgi:deoxycytidylate deaminase
MKKIVKPGRPSWDEYFLEMANLVAKRSTCLRRRVGAVLVKDKRILATGYNGAPRGLKHCLDIGCIRQKLNIPSGERHELCLPPGEEIFTNEGYMPINEIKIGQKVLTHRGVYRKVTKVFKREYEGLLYYIEPWYLLPVALTANHPVLVTRTKQCQFDTRTLCKETCKSVNKAYCEKPYLNYKLEWMPACKLKKRDMVNLLFDNRGYSIEEIDFSFISDAPLNYYQVLEEKSQGKSYATIQKKLNIWPSTAYNWVKGGAPRDCIVVYDEYLKHGPSPSKIVPYRAKLTPALLRLIGFYLAEGSSSSNQLSFSFHRKEKQYIEEIKDTMRNVFDLGCYENKKQNVHVLVYSSIILAKAFKILFGKNAYTKSLPHFLTRLSREEQAHILSAYVQGDGYKIDEDTTTISTASGRLALQIMQILLRLGYIPIIDKGRGVYRVIWRDKFKISYAYLKDNVFSTPIRKIFTKEYSGYVYNLEVEEDHSYITKSFIVHNCRALHAEQNALIQASLYGISVQESTLYATNQPCIICAKMLINAGISEIVIADGYPDKMAMDFLRQAKVRVRRVTQPLLGREKYEKGRAG